VPQQFALHHLAGSLIRASEPVIGASFRVLWRNQSNRAHARRVQGGYYFRPCGEGSLSRYNDRGMSDIHRKFLRW
jgi:hypothetical protein